MQKDKGLPVCPYYQHEKTKDGLRCELARLYLPDAESKEEIKAYCCDMDKHKECTLYKVMNSYYDRKYEGR